MGKQDWRHNVEAARATIESAVENGIITNERADELQSQYTEHGDFQKLWSDVHGAPHPGYVHEADLPDEAEVPPSKPRYKGIINRILRIPS